MASDAVAPARTMLVVVPGPRGPGPPAPPAMAVPSSGTTSPPPSRYEIHCSRALPTIDPTVAVKHVLFPNPHRLRAVNAGLHRHRMHLTFGYWCGVVTGIVALLLPAGPAAQWLAIGSAVLQTIPTIATALVLCWDLVVLCMTTYEFWFLTASNVISMTLNARAFGDARGCVFVAAGLSVEIAILADANHRATRLTILASVVGAIVNFLYVVGTSAELIGGAKDRVLVDYHDRRLMASDVVMNTMVTVVVLLIRNGIRKYFVTSIRGRTVTFSSRRVVRLIAYRCRVRLVQVGTSDNTSRRRFATTAVLDAVPGPSTAHASSGTKTKVALRFDGDAESFDADDTLVHQCFPRWLRISPAMGWAWRLLLWPSAIAGLVGIASSGQAVTPSAIMGSGLVALGTTGLVTVSYGLHAQRQLVRRLLMSFDFVFVSVQLTISHLCAADIVSWDPRTLGVVASWLWMHWVLTLDAVPPETRTRLGFHRALPVLVVSLFVVLQLAVVVGLVITEDTRLRDRLLFTVRLRHHTKHVYVVPLLLGRVVATMSWALRLLWRLRDRRDGELLILQGPVHFEVGSGGGVGIHEGHSKTTTASAREPAAR